MSVGGVWEDALGTRVPWASWLVEEDGEVLAARDPDRLFPSASMIKTFVHAVALERGPDPETRVQVDPGLRPPDARFLGELTLPLELSVRDLLHLMVAVSDNTATNAVLAALGGPEEVNGVLAEWGYATRIRRWVGEVRPTTPSSAAAQADPALPSPAGLGVTSATEHARVLAGLGADGLAPLLAQTDRRGLARGLREDAPFAHKTGWAGRVRHDGGLLLAEGRRVSVQAFTDGGPEPVWTDHPALVGMGLAMTGTCRALGLDVLAAP